MSAVEAALQGRRKGRLTPRGKITTRYKNAGSGAPAGLAFSPSRQTVKENAMALKTPAEYVESLRDGRVTYWDGERIDDITAHPKFKTPIAVACGDYDYANSARREVMTYRTDEGGVAHRVFQIPRAEADLHRRIELMHDMSIVGGVTGVFM